MNLGILKDLSDAMAKGVLDSLVNAKLDPWDTDALSRLSTKGPGSGCIGSPGLAALHVKTISSSSLKHNGSTTEHTGTGLGMRDTLDVGSRLADVVQASQVSGLELGP